VWLVGLDDLVNKAKDLLGGAENKADEAAASAAAGDTATAGAQAAESSSMIDKAKELLTDERIDQAAGAIKGLTPDNIDGQVDNIAGKAKDWNN
jgi:hypothetical protein